MKKIVIVGGGISGVFASIKIKENHPDYLVSVFEHNDKLLKKVYATGNGKCNFANTGDPKDKYNHPEFVLPILDTFDVSDMVHHFGAYGIQSKEVGNLLYPYSESAETVALKLLEQVDKLGIDVHLNENVLDYSKNKVITSIGSYDYDSLIISVGGKSSSKLGSDGSLFDVLNKHGYKLIEMSPSLCPVVVKENTKMVEGLRQKSLVYLYQGNKLIHQEEGEVLFKKDGLSGMVIFNMTHYINRLDNKNDIRIVIDFAPNRDGKYDSLVHPKLAKYLLDNKLDIHHTSFTFKKLYDFEVAHVTSGGVSLDNVNKDLSSKLEDNVFFIGEVLDIDGTCGGFNIMWALASAHQAAIMIK